MSDGQGLWPASEPSDSELQNLKQFGNLRVAKLESHETFKNVSILRFQFDKETL